MPRTIQRSRHGHLVNLPPNVEDAFDERRQHWLGDQATWEPLFSRLASDEHSELLSDLEASELLTAAQAGSVSALRRSAEGRAVQIGDASELSDDLVTLLAAAFAKGEPHAPAIPYAHLTQ